MLAPLLVGASAGILGMMGILHLVLTFWGGKLAPRDTAVQTAMQTTNLSLTAETTVWRAWLGFNSSHSMCAIFFGLVFGFLAARHPDFLFHSAYLQLLSGAVLLCFVILARLYWFSMPLLGVSIALGCYVAGCVAAHV